MPSLTDGAVRAAIKKAVKLGKQVSLTDGEGRGTGRLALIIKPMPRGATADWMAQQWRDGKRIKAKIGAYPAMSLAEAREVFQRDFSGVILKGGSVKLAHDTRPGSVEDLFTAYVEHLRSTAKPSWPDVQASLTKVATLLGQSRPARDITPDEILGILRPVYERGKRSMADHIRSYVRSAYSWGIKSENDYRHSSVRRFKIINNPAAAIPTEPMVVGTRWLDEAEFARLYKWLENPDAPVHPPYTRAVRLLMLTGQRVEEIARLHVDQFDVQEKILDWSTTKNGRSHAIPLPEIAFNLLRSIIPNKYGWFFPSATDSSKPVSAGTLYSFLWRQRERGVVPLVTNRDLRRTWKTLAGKAGVTKEIRDRLQNHALQDVSSKNYDRWTYMPEKRAGMKLWNDFIEATINTRLNRDVA